MDLKRVSLGYQRGSIKMAERFSLEALERVKEVDTTTVKEYIKIILFKIEAMQRSDKKDIAEDAMMFSTLIQNYTQRFIK